MEESKSVDGERNAGGIRAPLQRSDVDVAIESVVDWMIQGANGSQILEAIAEKFPTLDSSTLIRGAGDHFDRIARADTSLLRGWCFEATRDLYRKMLEVGDYPNALRAVKQMRDFAK